MNAAPWLGPSPFWLSIRAPAKAPLAFLVATLLTQLANAQAPAAPPHAAEPPATEPEPATYGAHAKTRAEPTTVKQFELEEMRELPGAFGDPFRVLDTLPGVTPVLSGAPYVYVRGAPPASTVYYYDDIAVPALFHLGVLNAVIHPAMLGDLDFYASVAPARYGRRTGGVFAAQGPALPSDETLDEIELRLIDASAKLDLPLGAGARVTVAGRYGYPGPVLGLVMPEVSLAYWDYQTRAELPVGTRDRLVLVWFGSYDDLRAEGTHLRLMFQRAELRFIHRLSDFEFGAALQVGYDESAANDEISVSGTRLGPRTWVRYRIDRHTQLRFGADMLATLGRIHTQAMRVPIDGSDLPDITGMPGLDFNSDSDRGLLGGGNDGQSQQAKHRNMLGAYGELNLRPLRALELVLGVRADLWLTGNAQAGALSPDAGITWHLSEQHALHVAAGLSHQPAVFPIPVPGLADIVLDHGLQRASQVEAGYRLSIARVLQFESTLFYSYLSGMVFPELFVDCDARIGPDCAGEAFPRATADAYGLELFLKRPSHHRVSGWLSYTLGRGVGRGPAGLSFTPQFDVRHVGNLVLQFDLGGGFRLGTRAMARTGRSAARRNVTLTTGSEVLFERAEQRLPGFARIDLLAAYGWTTGWGKLRLSFEWLNVTLAREAVDLRYCHDVTDLQTDCGYVYAGPITAPNLGLRAEF